MGSKNIEPRNLSNHSDTTLVSKGIRYLLRRIEPYEEQILTGRTQKGKASIYINGPAIFGEYTHNGMVIIENEYYIAVIRDNQTGQAQRISFNGHPALLVPLDHCFHIKEKRG